MKKLILILAVSLIALSTQAQTIQLGKPFIIDTIVKTPYGISLNKVAVQWKQESNYGNEPAITYSFRFYSDTAALNRNENPITVFARGWSVDTLGVKTVSYYSFGYEKETYSIEEFFTITPVKMYSNVQGILKKHFGNNIIQ